MRLRAAIAVTGVVLAAAALAGCSNDSKDATATTTTASTTTTDTTTTPATTQPPTLVVYAKPTRAQFVDHNDDRERGDFTSPFDPDVLPTPPNANSSKVGARAGDNAFFSFKVYSDAALTQAIGTTTYHCTFNFDQEANCEVNVNLTDGTMIATGPTRLNGTTIILPVTGGTGTYEGAHGQLTSKSANTTSNTQVIRFQLL